MRVLLALLSITVWQLACQPAPKRPSFGAPQLGGSDQNPDDDDPDSDFGDGLGGGKDADQFDLRCDAEDTHRGLRGWRRLSNKELQNTVEQLFGLTSGVDYSSFPSDIPKKEAFDTVMVPSNYVTGPRFKGYQTFAASLAAKIDFARYLPCTADTANCLNNKLGDFLTLAWRRPATQEEVADLILVFSDLQKEGLTADAALRWVVQAAVLSHNFLYRSELGVKQDDGSYALTDYELASALSYAVLRRPPDATLLKLAAEGALSNESTLKEQATRLLADTKAPEAWKDFGEMWLDGSRIKLTEKPLVPTYTADAKLKMIAELRDTFSATMFDAKASNYKALLTADSTVADASLSSFYDSVAAAGKMPYAQPERRGILGQVGFLSSHSSADTPSPILRGVFVAERLLCYHFLMPPPFTPPTPKPGLSNKDLFKAHSVGHCAGCHALIDNIGFAFENFDAIGKFRAIDAGQPIVVDSKLTLDGKELPIKSPGELYAAIADSKQASQCYVREVFRYNFGRTEFYHRTTVGGKGKEGLSAQGELDKCAIETTAAKMQASGGDLKTAILEMVSSPAFRLRLIGKPEE